QFFATLAAAGLQVQGRELPDHALPTAGDLDFGDDLPVFMTEKDAVKCSGLGLSRHWYVEAVAGINPADATSIMDKVERALGAR
ncbi:MAG TPA: tetraacyldisaccharide 4'-kinase, partial [Gammaproteobacteria bacterium]